MYTLREPRRVRARKPHRCCWCGKKIAVGEEHTAGTYKIDYVYDWRECDRCAGHVAEMFCDPRWGYDDGCGVTAETFAAFMEESLPDVLRAWGGEDGRSRA